MFGPILVALILSALLSKVWAQRPKSDSKSLTNDVYKNAEEDSNKRSVTFGR